MNNPINWLERKLNFKIKQLHFCIFWLCLNLIQAAFTQLTSDEGYYWFYSRSLDWGYYDHPPFLALLIKIGYSIFHNEFGVRLLYVLLNGISVYLLFKLIDDETDNKRRNFIYLIILSLPLLNYLSFLVFPDGPLLFFEMAFLTSYKRFIKKADWPSVLFIAISTALMMYSKYHAVLVIGFTIISNIKLLRSVKFYAATLLALLLFVPHVWWQYTHHFATFQYHLKGRTSPFSTKHVFEYISQQIAAIGPGLIFVPFVYKAKGQMEKTFQYIIIGTFAFFLFSSFKDFIHFHWTSLTILPLVLIASAYYTKTNKQKLFNYLVLPFAFIVLLFRLQLLFRIFPVNNVGIDYYHGRDLWAQDIKQIAGNHPVFFRNNFRESSLYSFYSGQMGVSLQNGEKRRSQYEIWHYEDSLQHKDVLFVNEGHFDGSTELKTRMGKTIYYKWMPDFVSYFDVHVEANVPEEIKKQTQQLSLEVTIKNPRSTSLIFPANGTGLFYSLKKGNKEVKHEWCYQFSPANNLPPNGEQKINIHIPTADLEKGKYTLVLGISHPPLDDSFNSDAYPVEVK